MRKTSGDVILESALDKAVNHRATVSKRALKMCPAQNVEFSTVINKPSHNAWDFVNTQKSTKPSSGTLTGQAERNISKPNEQ